MKRQDKVVWIFGYGSMFWYQNFRFIECRRGTLPGYHREWTWISSSRGCVPTCSLKEGGKVNGIFFRLDPNNWEEEIKKVRRREVRQSEKVLDNIPGIDGEVYFWTQGDNTSDFLDLRNKTGNDLYQALAKRAKGVLKRGPDGCTAEEYARRVHENDPECEETKRYIKALDSLA